MIVPGAERFFRAGALMLFSQFIRGLFKRSSAQTCIQRGFEPAPVTNLILLEVTTGPLVFQLFVIPDSEPPIFTRRVDAFSAGLE